MADTNASPNLASGVAKTKRNIKNEPAVRQLEQAAKRAVQVKNRKEG